MQSIQAFANAQWSLEEFVQTVNVLLPQFLPQEKSNQRVREEVTVRLIRHYTSLGMLDDPGREGKEARYNYRHLLQVLVLRRLLAQGYTATAIDSFTLQKDNHELIDLLQGGTQMTVMPANPALAFLEQVKSRKSPNSVVERSVNAQPRQEPAPKTWIHLEVLPGLELQVREDFQYPASFQERQNLMDLIQRLLSTPTNKRRPHP